MDDQMPRRADDFRISPWTEERVAPPRSRVLRDDERQTIRERNDRLVTDYIRRFFEEGR